jgi:ATP-dependent RNA helicase DeaD
VLRDFTKAKTQILVATDIAARGIDIEGITHVFSYDVPHDVDYYIHRIGRTGRAGNEGLSVMFATGQDENWVRRIEHTIQATITKYTANGKVKVKSNTRPPKKKQSFKDKLPISSYQSTKEKRHKSLHKGGDNRRRRRR